MKKKLLAARVNALVSCLPYFSRTYSTYWSLGWVIVTALAPPRPYLAHCVALFALRLLFLFLFSVWWRARMCCENTTKVNIRRALSAWMHTTEWPATGKQKNSAWHKSVLEEQGGQWAPHAAKVYWAHRGIPVFFSLRSAISRFDRDVVYDDLCFSSRVL